jgi:hypothetical protein
MQSCVLLRAAINVHEVVAVDIVGSMRHKSRETQ